MGQVVAEFPGITSSRVASICVVSMRKWFHRNGNGLCGQPKVASGPSTGMYKTDVGNSDLL